MLHRDILRQMVIFSSCLAEGMLLENGNKMYNLHMFKFKVLLFRLLFFQAGNQNPPSERQTAEGLMSPWQSEESLSNCRDTRVFIGNVIISNSLLKFSVSGVKCCLYWQRKSTGAAQRILFFPEVQAVLTRLSKAVRASVFQGVGLCLAQHGPGPGGDQENNPLSWDVRYLC